MGVDVRLSAMVPVTMKGHNAMKYVIRFWHWLCTDFLPYLIPKRIVYGCALRVLAHATRDDGPFVGHVTHEVDGVTFVDADNITAKMVIRYWYGHHKLSSKLEQELTSRVAGYWRSQLEDDLSNKYRQKTKGLL